ncbi:hypothetical protein CKAH01_00382 [Colletotrichum kahawae]|uniref:Uncharacterized protein n=1 Tax=Colletotrichum kahawae TaxID=34407 RepID=A0AAD9YXH3_COLKA|nr:hypothetical protein CKAH01_00382 [Colletotrichum kahawae]
MLKLALVCLTSIFILYLHWWIYAPGSCQGLLFVVPVCTTRPCLIQTGRAPKTRHLPSLTLHTSIQAATVRLDARCRGLLPTTKTRPDGLVVQRRRGAIEAYWPPKPKVAGASPVVGAFFRRFFFSFFCLPFHSWH